MLGYIPYCNWVYSDRCSTSPVGAAPPCTSLQTYFMHDLSVWSHLVILAKQHPYLLGDFTWGVDFSLAVFYIFWSSASSCVQFTPRLRWPVLQRDAYKQLLQMVLLSAGHLNADNLLLWSLTYSTHSACFGDPPSPMIHISLRDAGAGTIEVK